MADKKCPWRFHLPEKKQTCIKHDCEFYIHLQGMDPQTGQPRDEFGCSIRWLPILLIENSNQQRQTKAGIDKVATEVNKHKQVFLKALSPEVQERVLTSPPLPQLEEKNGL